MPKIEIISEIYMFESLIALFLIALTIFLSIFIGKDWYKSLVNFFKKNK